jgi:hypothetical protein
MQMSKSPIISGYGADGQHDVSLEVFSVWQICVNTTMAKIF